MDIRQSDAFVFFGATGDLAFKKIFPALQAMIKHGHLDVPVIGVARSAKNVDELRARVRTSLEEHGGLDAAAFDKLSSLLRYVQGNNSDPATHQALRQALAGAKHPIFLSGYPAHQLRGGRRAAWKIGLQQRGARHYRKTLRPRWGFCQGT